MRKRSRSVAMERQACRLQLRRSANFILSSKAETKRPSVSVSRKRSPRSNRNSKRRSASCAIHHSSTERRAKSWKNIDSARSTSPTNSRSSGVREILRREIDAVLLDGSAEAQEIIAQLRRVAGAVIFFVQLEVHAAVRLQMRAQIAKENAPFRWAPDGIGFVIVETNHVRGE